MYTSVTKLISFVRRDIAAAFFCFAASRIYDMFSHGVHSLFMDMFFLIPVLNALFLMACILVFQVRRLRQTKWYFLSGLTDLFFFSRLACTFVCTGMFLCGVLRIAGTRSYLPRILFFAGGLLFLKGIFSFIHIAAHRSDLPLLLSMPDKFQKRCRRQQKTSPQE